MNHQLDLWVGSQCLSVCVCFLGPLNYLWSPPASLFLHQLGCSSMERKMVHWGHFRELWHGSDGTLTGKNCLGLGHAGQEPAGSHTGF